MQIQLENIGRRFNKEWIFRHVDTVFENGNAYSVLGSNGSGKSTFLQLLSGFLIPSEGTITYSINNQIIQQDEIFRHFSICSPFLELYDEMTIDEAFRFQNNLKHSRNKINEKDFFELLQLNTGRNKQLKNFSSGMRQRVKLGLAIIADTSLLFLDEPCTNLDSKAIDWYQKTVTEHLKNRLLFVSSNNLKEELFCCNQEFKIEEFKNYEGERN